MKGKRAKIGDCFELKVNDTTYVYIQYVAKDESLFNGKCVRFFNKIEKKSINAIDFNRVYSSGSWFYGHTTIVPSTYNFYRLIANKDIPNEELDNLTFYTKFEDIAGINGKLENIYRIRKLGQSFEDANVGKKTFDSYKEKSYPDGFMFPEGYITVINHKLENPDFQFP